MSSYLSSTGIIFILLSGVFWILDLLYRDSKSLRTIYTDWWLNIEKLGFRRIYKLPVALTNYIYTKIFGSIIISKKSFKTLIYISITLNIICMLMILSNEIISGQEIIIPLITNFLFFIFINVTGDFVSLIFTRKVIDKILNNKTPLWFLVDLLGIILSYLLILGISLLILFIVFMINNEAQLTTLIYSGLTGGFVIPYFLLMIIYSGESILLSLVAFMSLFSITIPTLIYLMVTFVFIILPKKELIFKFVLKILEALDDNTRSKSIYIDINRLFGWIGVFLISLGPILNV